MQMTEFVSSEGSLFGVLIDSHLLCLMQRFLFCGCESPFVIKASVILGLDPPVLTSPYKAILSPTTSTLKGPEGLGIPHEFVTTWSSQRQWVFPEAQSSEGQFFYLPSCSAKIIY